MAIGPKTSGLMKLVIGAGIGLAALALVPERPPDGRTSKVAMIAIIGPIVMLIGLFEVLSGVRASQWAQSWPLLPGWLKFFITLLAIAALLFLVIGLIVVSR